MPTETTAPKVLIPIHGRNRLDSIDLLRGLVMVVMLLDHSRDFVHNTAFRFDPLDLTQTSFLLYLTRWVTHFCAPVFVFLAGTGAFLQAARGKTKGELSKFLFLRGLWLIFLELTVVRCLIWFNFDYSLIGPLQVIWTIGFSMIVLAALIHLPLFAIAGFGIAMIALHNLLDGVDVFQNGVPGFAGGLWLILHHAGFFQPFGASGPQVFVLYPLIPWIGVMAAGYAFGAVYQWEADRRRRFLWRLGVGLVLIFLALRALDVYGEPQKWGPQANPLWTALSFLNVTKYPPSLCYLLITLGPAIAALAWLERPNRNWIGRGLVQFGRVPLFFYFLQWVFAHGTAVFLGLLAGQSVSWQFLNPNQKFGERPADTGFDLWVVYAVWIAGILLLYPLCVWFGRVKQRRTEWWLRFL